MGIARDRKTLVCVSWRISSGCLRKRGDPGGSDPGDSQDNLREGALHFISVAAAPGPRSAQLTVSIPAAGTGSPHVHRNTGLSFQLPPVWGAGRATSWCSWLETNTLRRVFGLFKHTRFHASLCPAAGKVPRGCGG